MTPDARLGLVVLLCAGVVHSFNVVEMLQATKCHIADEIIARELIDDIKLRFYTGRSASDFVSVPLNESAHLIRHQGFNMSQCMVVYIFGFNMSPNDGDSEIIINSYLRRGGYNVLLVDWESVTTLDFNSTVFLPGELQTGVRYSLSVAVMKRAARTIARALDAILGAGARLCHIVGHSLGGQCAGAVARSMQHAVPHLVGLDPAGPLFYSPLRCARPISESDALCVEVVHTDGGLAGALPPTGGVDHFPNGGSRSQPGCTDINVLNITNSSLDLWCSHNRALFLWSEAVLNASSLVSLECSSWLDFNAGKCNGHRRAYIGKCTKRSPAGRYYLKTNSSAPYGEGLEGIKSTPVELGFSVVSTIFNSLLGVPRFIAKLI